MTDRETKAEKRHVTSVSAELGRRRGVWSIVPLLTSPPPRCHESRSRPYGLFADNNILKQNYPHGCEHTHTQRTKASTQQIYNKYKYHPSSVSYLPV